MGEALVLPLRAVVDAVFKAYNTGDLVLEIAEGVGDFPDLRFGGVGRVLEDDDVADHAAIGHFFHFGFFHVGVLGSGRADEENSG